MYSTEFFRTLEEAEAFRPSRALAVDVYGLDKPGTVRRFREYQDDALAWERYAEAENARAVAVIWR